MNSNNNNNNNKSFNGAVVARIHTPDHNSEDDQEMETTSSPYAVSSAVKFPASANADDGLSIGPFTPEQEQELINLRAERVGGKISMESISLRSNCKTLDDVVDVINSGKESPASESFIGTLVSEGHIGFIEKNGIMTAVGPGRYLLPHPRADWDKIEKLSGNPHIKCGPISIVRIPPGHYGRAFLANEPVLLRSEDGGLFAFNNPTFRFVDTITVDSKLIKHETIYVVRVPRGKYACVVENNRPAFLPTGVYVFKSEDFDLHSFVDLSNDSIQFRTLARFFVPKGTIGLAWRDSVPVFLQERGIYFVDSPMFRFVGSENIEKPCITHGSKKIVTVKEGLVGISHDRGVLKVLEPGRWVIESEGHIFDEFLSTQQQCLALSKDDTHRDLMVCETRELVRIGIQASVFYNIQNPKLAVVKIGERVAIEHFINETATAVITTIIRSTSLAEIAQQSSASGQPVRRIKDDANNKDDDFAPNAPFFDRMHSDFISRLQENFLKEYGIHMLNMRIGDFKVIDKDIATSISNHVSTMAQTQAKLANLEGNKKIELVNKDAAAQLERIQAQVDAQKVEVKAKADAEASMQKARAVAETRIIETETNLKNKDAEAKLERIQAEVDAQKIELKAKADAEASMQKARALAETRTIEADTSLKNKDAEAKMARMEAELVAHRTATKSKADAEARLEAARANAEAMKLEAEAKAASIRMIAEAEAAAIRVKADADTERAKKLGSVDFGREVTLAEIQANMVQGSLSGVSKVVYLPTELQKNPFALFGNQGMANAIQGKGDNNQPLIN